MKNPLSVIGIVLMTGCSVTAPEATDWIEIPLSDNTWAAADRPWLSGDYQVDVAAGAALEYKIGMQESGSLTAPFSGIHGWYLNNRSNEDIVVNISIAGFYEVLQ